MAAPCGKSPIDYCASWSPCSRLDPSSIAQRPHRRSSVVLQRKLHEPLVRGWGVLAPPSSPYLCGTHSQLLQIARVCGVICSSDGTGESVIGAALRQHSCHTSVCNIRGAL